MRRERLLGEARVAFDQLNLQVEANLWLALQPPPSSSVRLLYRDIFFCNKALDNGGISKN